MPMIPIDWLPPIMFACLLLFMVSGFPVAFALAANGLLFGYIAIEQGLMSPALLQALPERIFGIMGNETLLAIPFFTFMGLILERSGMAEELLETIGQLFGRIRGGLAYAVILVGALLAATTGVVAASVISMGLISLPVMLKYGYSKSVASGVIAASGTLAQIIPPSLVLIVMADQLGVSVGAMYQGAMIPGLMLVGLFFIYILLISLFNKNAVPALPPEACNLKEANGNSGFISFLVVSVLSAVLGYLAFVYLSTPSALSETMLVRDSAVVAAIAMGIGLAFVMAYVNRKLKLGLISTLGEAVIFVLIPPLALIFLVLGTIYVGIATPTEGGAMGAVGALLLALLKNRLSMPLMKQALDSTTKLACFVMFILIGSTVFSLTFRAIHGDVWVEHLMGNLPGGEVGFIIAVNVLVFILGCFIDFFEIAFIAVPLLMPVANKLGIDPVWFGVMIAMNLQTSFLTPPFGFSLFYLKSVTPKSVKTIDIYKGAIPFIVLQLMMVTAIYAFPNLVKQEKKVKFHDAPLQLELEEQNYGADPYGQDAGQSAYPSEPVK